jgi:hypothetical protein
MVSLLDPNDMSSPSRWTALRSALMEPTMGVVKSLEHDARIGMLMFDGPIPGDIPLALPDGGTATFPAGPAQTCPRLIRVEPARDNYAAIDKAYMTQPLGGSTPTDKVLNELLSADDAGTDQNESPTIIVLATDGEPNDMCSSAFPPRDVGPDVLQIVKQLAMSGTKTYVISLAGTDTNLMSFCAQVAAAGGTGTAPYAPSTKDALVQAFRNIIGTGTQCDFQVNVHLEPSADCKISVELNGAKLQCNDANGFRVSDDSTLTLLGASCDALKADQHAILHAEFPCEM